MRASWVECGFIRSCSPALRPHAPRSPRRGMASQAHLTAPRLHSHPDPCFQLTWWLCGTLKQCLWFIPSPICSWRKGGWMRFSLAARVARDGASFIIRSSWPLRPPTGHLRSCPPGPGSPAISPHLLAVGLAVPAPTTHAWWSLGIFTLFSVGAAVWVLAGGLFQSQRLGVPELVVLLALVSSGSALLSWFGFYLSLV